MPPTAIDLLERMLVFDPNRRISGNKHKDPQNIQMRFFTVWFGLSIVFGLFAFASVLCIVDEALGHAYLSPHHDVNKEPVCSTPFSFDFEHPSCTEEHIKELIYKESVKFNPDH